MYTLVLPSIIIICQVVVYVCFHSGSDTVSRSGVYCAVSIALEQCKAEGVVDVFQVTKGLKRSKPGAITTIVMI